MAAIDKIYFEGSYDDYQALKEWCGNQPLLYDKYNTPWKLSDSIYEYNEETWKSGNIVFNAPYYVDAYLIRNCPFKAVQKELMLNYGHWSQERIKSYYEDIQNWDSTKGECPYWAKLEDFITLEDGIMTIRGLEKSDYMKIKDGELYTSPKRNTYEYGKHFKCIRHPSRHYNKPFKCQRWFITVDTPYDYMWYHQNHNSWDFADEFVISAWSSNTAHVKTIRALKRLMLKWKLPVGTIVLVTGRYIFDEYKFIITK